MSASVYKSRPPGPKPPFRRSNRLARRKLPSSRLGRSRWRGGHCLGSGAANSGLSQVGSRGRRFLCPLRKRMLETQAPPLSEGTTQPICNSPTVRCTL